MVTNINEINKAPNPKKAKQIIENLLVDSGAQINSPISGTILKYLVKNGDKITKDQPLVNIESMKMENTIKSDKEGIVNNINFKIGDSVNTADTLLTLN